MVPAVSRHVRSRRRVQGWWPADELQIVVRAVDAGDTYLTYRPLVPDANVIPHRVRAADLTPLLAELASALPDPIPGEVSGPDHIKRALNGALTSLQRERKLSETLGSLVIPPEVWQLVAAAELPVRLRITPSARLATVPWELLMLPNGRRLLEMAILAFELPPTIHYRRPRRPDSRCIDPALPPLRTIDPVVPPRTPFRRAMSAAGRDLIRQRLDVPCQEIVTREDLGAALRASPPRWVYFGHVSIAEPGIPGAAGLHLSDAGVRGEPPFGGSGRLYPLGHRALTVIDMLIGTREESWFTHDRPPAALGLSGVDIWPMPPRVALIACNSGADHTATEPLGLVAATQLLGAEIVTATRWSLPTDAAFSTLRSYHERMPATELVLAVDAAHESADPIVAVRDWQLGQLAAWEATGDLGFTPLVFAALTTHHAPAREADGRDPDWPPFADDGTGDLGR